MIKSESVADLLTHDKILPSCGVVWRAIKVSIVDFCYPLGNVAAADPNLSYSKPAVIAIFAIAYLYPSKRGSAIFRISTARHNCRV